MFDVKDFLVDFDNSNLPRTNDGFFECNDKIHEYRPTMHFSRYGDPNFKFDDTLMYAKRISEPKIASEIVCGLLYNKLNVNSVYSYPLLYWGVLYSATQFLFSMEKDKVFDLGSQTQIGLKIIGRSLIDFLNSKEELYDSGFSDELYNQFINMVILDNLVMNQDRHLNNFFTVYNEILKKYTGIVTIDHSDSFLKYDLPIDELLKFPCVFCHNNIMGHGETYINKLYSLKRLLQSGKLGSEQIELMENAKNLNMEELIRNYTNKTGYVLDEKMSDNYKYVWTHMQQEFDKEF